MTTDRNHTGARCKDLTQEQRSKRERESDLPQALSEAFFSLFSCQNIQMSTIN